ncbi:coproporphyrinogen III oxidase [Salinibacterium sp. NSLL150]|uniref:radical SAM family heme chaperone HemW n=1 Tax=unclassified Salinibacterium TaxID=2632331 RepID=UPI0018CDB3EE|nr:MULTISPECIES: radical SAM family heme chaperone HemW [unclassified Salinibacterium]MBH0098908.1 coproporphyrinogen III oxidase [Salinibacterium sp. NSLL35]MBH0101663.1 coproporphyrinogen III oxidase [Salinibacterium sp. NSLL150]MBH0104422.1 coproporphyrinogen III oxidase [Salinibacterium sp. NSLL16]MBH0107183.1 coproporphyrinogen III oxidase [Salinibacterium sp. NSLL17]
MPGALPIADPAPLDGALPESVAVDSANRDWSVYIHVPFCRVRCGYCDFNTYTGEELRGAKRSDYATEAIAEIRQASTVLSDAGVAPRKASTVFFGGGTPTLLPVTDLTRMLAAARDTWGFTDDVEVTTEANPDSVDRDYLLALKEAGFTRVSFGMQSAVPHVLATLERTHDPEKVPHVVKWARDVELDVSVDLIYGTPGESLADWERSLDHAIAQNPDHISAYALIIETGTKLAAQIKRGDVAPVDDDLQADMYELADAKLAAAGYDWYEVSNWAKRDANPAISHVSRHNLGYWLGNDWWGVGPGAHSHVGGVRWWNVKHPAAYADRIAAGHSPGAGRETLADSSKYLEHVLLRARVRNALTTASLDAEGRTAVAGLIADELVEARAAIGGTINLTLKGRLLADAVVRRLLADAPV